MSRTALYRHFGSAGRLLYVGISLSFSKRLADHNKRSHWASSIARADVEYFETREQALAAERHAIKTEAPLHNIKLVSSVSKPQPPPVAAPVPPPSLKQGERDLVICHTLEQCAEALGVAMSTMWLILRDGKLKSFKAGGSRRITAEAFKAYQAGKS